MVDTFVAAVMLSWCFLPVAICIWRTSNIFTKLTSFFFRSTEMAEALTNSFQNLYNKYTRSENTENAALNDRREIYIVPVATTNGTDSQLLQRYRSKSRRVFSFDTKLLCQTKETKWHTMRLKRMRPLIGQCCLACIPVRQKQFWIFFLY